MVMLPYEIVQKLKSAGFAASNRKIAARDGRADGEPLKPLEERVDDLIGIVCNKERKSTNMLFFVMYDIESDKVRRLVAKYLLRQGCSRVQGSVFLADLPPDRYQEIRSDLTEVQAAYDNHDSILVVPISTDHLKAMKIIGKNISVDVITGSANTLFF